MVRKKGKEKQHINAWKQSLRMRSVKLIRSDWWSRKKEVSDTETTTKNTHTVKEGMNEWLLSVSVSDVNFGMLFFVELVHT